MTADAIEAQRLGATPAEWSHWHKLAGGDLLPAVVAQSSAPVWPRSVLEGPDGKTPSQYTVQGEVVGMPGWVDHLSSDADLRRWSTKPDYNVCIIGRTFAAIDVDIDDPERAAAVRDAIELTVGKLPARVRANSGKFLLLFACCGVSKRKVKTPHGVVELLGERQQFVVGGTHKSGARIDWEGGLPCAVPALTPDEVRELFDALDAAFGDGTSREKKRHVAPAPRDGGDDLAAAWLHEHWEVRGASSDGKLYVRCPNEAEHSDAGDDTSTAYMPGGGFKCLHSHCDDITGSVFLRLVGFDDPANDFAVVELAPEEEAEAAQASERNAKKPARVVLETERERAQRQERERSKAIGDGTAAQIPLQRVLTGSEMLEEFVYIEDGARVARADDPRNVLTFEDFKRATAASIESTKTPTGRATKVDRATLWLKSPDRKSVKTQTFAPGRAAVCQSPEGQLAQNLWQPRRAAPPENWRALSAPFFEHVEYLVPVAVERERFLDWLAHIEQDPGTLPSTHYLMVAPETGIGRNWMAYALARAFPRYTALGFDLAQALRSGYTGGLSAKLLVVVDELHEGGPGGAHTPAAEKLKSMLTEATRTINPKYGRQHIEFNCSRFLMFSNHTAALPLADNDRRIVVIENPKERKSADYFVRLYALLDDPDFGAAVSEALRRRDITGFNPGAVAPPSEAKARTIRAGRSEVEQAVRDVAREWPSDCITSSRLALAVSEALGGKAWSVQAPCVAAGLVKFDGRVRINGQHAHVWILRNAEQWRRTEFDALRAEVMRGQEAVDVAEFA